MILVIEKDNYILKFLQNKYDCVVLKQNDLQFLRCIDLIIINILEITEEYLENVEKIYAGIPLLVITDMQINEHSLRYVVNSKTNMLTFDYLIKKLLEISKQFGFLCQMSEKLSCWTKRQYER